MVTVATTTNKKPFLSSEVLLPGINVERQIYVCSKMLQDRNVYTGCEGLEHKKGVVKSTSRKSESPQREVELYGMYLKVYQMDMRDRTTRQSESWKQVLR